MQDHSQNGEQKIILAYFGDHRGTFLDIGANDGLTLSNTWALSLLGWSGVLVEPSKNAFTKLYYKHADATKRSTCINAAITPTDGPVDFWDCGVHLHKGDTSLLSTTREEEIQRWKRSGEQFTKTTVRGITFATLLKECELEVGDVVDSTDKFPHGLAHFDFISIDAEGLDYEILAQIDLTAVGCRMLCVETNNKDNQKFIDYAAKHGMRLHWRCVENLIFVR